MTCLLCGTTYDPAGKATDDGHLYATDAGVFSARPPTVVNTIARNRYPQTSVACARCAFVQVDPMPTAEEMRDYYASGLYRQEFPPLPRDGVSPDDPAYLETLELSASEQATFILTSLQFVAPRRIHEIGCGEGRLAAALARRGHEVSAWDEDPGMRAAAQSRGVRTVGRIVGDERDAVIACQVLEHMTDPIETLTEWRAMLKPGGLLHVEVPTLEAMYGGAAHFFQRPHVVNFTRRTLLLTLYRAGFRPGPVGISGSVLYCTAIAADECLSYEQAVAALGELVAVYERAGMVTGGLPLDDVPALIARHEASRPKPTLVDRWLALDMDGWYHQEEADALAAEAHDGDALRAEVRAMRDEVIRLRRDRERNRDTWVQLSHTLQAEIERLAEAWSPDPWRYGYDCGTMSALKRTQTLVDAQANNVIVGMEGK